MIIKKQVALCAYANVLRNSEIKKDELREFVTIVSLVSVK
ncbi:hypothetical protein SBF1_3580002 [Candidatus Desulfosporosinus infrequens]|uniref:Uncharacterized protein n=1 Tax=Candidatus Desulfosporosinus infrequens TaxID=2043169 RepID=A0A2U3L3D6_9FIRM|nr:hypothetical protein SBF1_3580002 [Candidatus Desulfosporosinus infrequens]